MNVQVYYKLVYIYITQRVLATPTLIGKWCYEIINVWILLEPLTYTKTSYTMS